MQTSSFFFKELRQESIDPTQVLQQPCSRRAQKCWGGGGGERGPVQAVFPPEDQIDEFPALGWEHLILEVKPLEGWV